MAPSSPQATTSTSRPPCTYEEENASSLTMRQLIQRLSCVGDCSSSSSPARKKSKAHAGVPKGHVPVHVGGGAEGTEERVLVRADMLGAPALAKLLGRAAQEYGYRHEGPLRIPCPVAVFRHALASVAGDDDGEEGQDGE